MAELESRGARARLAAGRGVAAAGLAFLLFAVAPLAVAAHAELVSSDPPAGASLPASPAQLSLTFTEPIDPGTATVRLVDTQQATVGGVGSPQVAAGTMVSATLPELDAGVYTVSYQVVSAVDGHATSGSFSFVVDPTGTEPAPPASTTSTAPAADLPAVAARWLALAMALAALGTLLFWIRYGARIVATAGGGVATAPWLLLAALCAVGFGALATYLALAARPLVEAGTHQVHGTFPLDFAAPFGWTPFGIAMRVALAGLGVAFVIAVFRTVRLDELRRCGAQPAAGDRRLAFATTSIVACGLLGMSLAGHVASLGGLPFAFLDWVHLLAAGAWLGAIPAFGVVAQRAARGERAAALRASMRAHGSTALIAAPILALTGLANSPLVLGSSRELLASGYGDLLLAKALLFSTAVGIGAANHFLARDPRPGRRAPLLVVEAAVAAAAVLVAAGLVTVPVAASRQPVLSATALGSTHLYGSVGPSGVHVAVNVAAPGPQRYQVAIADEATGAPREDVQKVFLSFIPPADADLPEQRVELPPTPGEPGLYGTTGAFTGVLGEWTLEVIVRRAGALDETLDFGLPIVDPVEPQLVPPPDTGVDAPAPLAVMWSVLPGGIAAWIPALVLLAGSAALGPLGVARQNPARWVRWTGVGLLCLAVVAAGAAGSRTVVAVANAAPASAVTAVNPIPTDDASIERGRLIFLANCSGCHGATGAGDGPIAATPLPDLAAVVPAMTDGELAYRITNGLAGTQMPGFATALSENDRWDLVNYLRDLGSGR
jgi:copper transport protein